MSSPDDHNYAGMGKVIENLKKADLRDKVKIMVGGAPVSLRLQRRSERRIHQKCHRSSRICKENWSEKHKGGQRP